MESLVRKKERVKKIIGKLEKAHPDAKLDLDFTSPLELLIALILAAQARDERINEITPALFKKYRSAAAWADEQEAKLFEQLNKINFYRNKTHSIQKACRLLADDFNGQVPENLDDLLKLPGVGRKTANIILANGFGQQAIGVDTHVKRLSQRLGFSTSDDPDEIEADATAIVPPTKRVKFCHVLQYHGRRVCHARKPGCPRCVVRELCPYPAKTE